MLPDERLAGWLRTWAEEKEARMAGRLSLHDVPAMLHVARSVTVDEAHAPVALR